mmetsp:Transcript_111045/g.155896  ORF Transcript_111045/g.155896 Transcript_111045/m.155896 type:complete len:203 (-) Transcript_111045:28-636(-)
MAPFSNLDFAAGDDQVATALALKTQMPLHHQTPLRKGVSFATNVATYDIIHLAEFSDEERESSWYNRNELRAIKDDAKRMANLSVMTDDATTDNINNADLCLRGLEAKTPSGSRKKRQNRIEARAAVFMEQEVQDDNGFSDPDELADVYFEYTESCQAEAQMIAIRDEKEAKEIYESSKFSDIDSLYGRLLIVAPASGSAAA